MQKKRVCGVGLALLAVAGVGAAAEKEVRYGPEASWVVPPPLSSPGATPEGSAFRMVYSDNQVHIGPEGIDAYQAFRIKVLKPEALSIGNVSVTWNPYGGEATVNHLRIVRGEQIINVLDTLRFNVLQREGFLESAMLNGDLTAALQVPGLQVGDELEFATTTRRRDPTLGDHAFGFVALTPLGMPGAMRLRVVWPETSPLKWQATPDVTGIAPVKSNGTSELVYQLTDPHPAITADGAPARVNLRRFIEYSDYGSWAEVSRQMWPLFDKASKLASDSPLKQEALQIAKASADPLQRMKVALRFVQDRIRYVYIGFNGGNFTPASADDTWERKFGDCKAKTAMLLAMLHELGISAEPVLADLGGGDGLDGHPPSPGDFNHVLVRATVGKVQYWLDGTRQGDPRLLTEPAQMLVWVLPVRVAGSALERLPLHRPKSPDQMTYMYVDTTSGFKEKAEVQITQVYRGDQMVPMRNALSVLSAESQEQALRGFWLKTNAWLDVTSTSWRYDEEGGALAISVKGKGHLDWTGSTGDRTLEIFGAGFYQPEEFLRPAEQDQLAPWKLGFPRYHCWATAIRLPKPEEKTYWNFVSPLINTRVGGFHYWRTADLRDGLMRTVMSTRSELPELTAAQAAESNKARESFDNNKSQVYEQEGSPVPDAFHTRDTRPPFELDTDWMRADVPCGPQVD